MKTDVNKSPSFVDCNHPHILSSTGPLSQAVSLSPYSNGQCQFKVMPTNSEEANNNYRYV